MAHRTGKHCVSGEEEQYVCHIKETLKCIDQEASSCEHNYETCNFEEYGYGVAGLIFPPLRCQSCRRERKGLTTTTHKCGICGRMFVVRGGSKCFWKTHGLATPPKYIIEGPWGPECARCCNLDDVEKEKRRKLLELKKQSILSQKKMEQLVRSRNPSLLKKILDGKLRKVDVAPVTKRYDENGNPIGYAYRRAGYTEVRNTEGNLQFKIYHKGTYSTLVDPSGRVIGYTFRRVSPSSGHYVTYKPDLSTIISRTYEQDDRNVTYDPDGKKIGTVCA